MIQSGADGTTKHLVQYILKFCYPDDKYKRLERQSAVEPILIKNLPRFENRIETLRKEIFWIRVSFLELLFFPLLLGCLMRLCVAL
mgnify:CR=1 FL=1